MTPDEIKKIEDKIEETLKFMSKQIQMNPQQKHIEILAKVTGISEEVIYEWRDSNAVVFKLTLSAMQSLDLSYTSQIEDLQNQIKDLQGQVEELMNDILVLSKQH